MFYFSLRMTIMTKKPLSFILAGLLAMASAAHADVGLYNTGVSASGSTLSNKSLDTHYTVSYNGVTNSAISFNSAQGYPFPYWLGDNSTSSWISPTSDTRGGGGDYVYKTSFDLTGIDLSSAKIVGRYANDDPLTGMSINGNTLAVNGGSMGAWTDFTINSGFVSGVNTLEFTVFNSFGPTGLRVEYTGNNFTAAVPEPEVLALALSGLAIVGMTARRRRG